MNIMEKPVLLIPHIKVQNANALSSPFTIGFPAMTAWLGAVHALQRKLNTMGVDVSFDAVGVISHQFDLQTYKGPGDYVYSIIGTANPLDRNGERPAFIEEARCHLTASLAVQFSGIGKLEEENFIACATRQLAGNMKIAGGDILAYRSLEIFSDFDQLKRRLMPGYVLLERRDLMIEAMESGQDAMDAILDFVSLHHHCEKKEVNGQTVVVWHSARKSTNSEGGRGWIVPVATGFHGISELAQAKKQRDADMPHRFAESVVTLGEFKMAYRLESENQLLWRYTHEPENNLYLCEQSPVEDDGF